jgi:membrane-bound lytic murein transglycosylase D
VKNTLLALGLLTLGCQTQSQPNGGSAPVDFLQKDGASVKQWIAEVDNEMVPQQQQQPDPTVAAQYPIADARKEVNYDSTQQDLGGEEEQESADETSIETAGEAVPAEPSERTDEAASSIMPEEPAPSDLPMEFNARVEGWIRFFTERDRERFQKFLDRGEKYRPLIEAVLAEYNVPKEIYYLAMIESGFQTHAKSRAAAVGVWQFIKGTGKRYGLRTDYYVDERRDPVRATIAAAMYLKDLHNVFQSWYLAMSAYNAGEGRIMNAIMSANTRDFWQLAEKKALPVETMNYVPKFLAAAIIGHHPEQFGFTKPSSDLLPALKGAKIPAPVRVVDIANAAGVSVSAIQELNPHLLRAMTPPGNGGVYQIWLPKDADISLATLEKKIVRGIAVKKDPPARVARKSAAAKPTATAAVSTKHRVRRGESLTSIARRYGTTVEQLKAANRLRRSTVFVGQVLKIAKL